jgi:quercetin dioxygenase-like cupin family protein
MKTNPLRMRTPLACALLLACAGAAAQDPGVVGTGIYKCTMENAHARVCEVSFAPGAKMPKHSHPAHVVYVIEPGTLRITDDTTGKSEDHAFKAGDSLWMEPVTHHAQNVGKTTLKGVVVEYRDLQTVPKTMNEAPPMDAPRTMNEAPPMDAPPMEKPAMGQPPTEQAPPDPLEDAADPADP